ncbi:MAG: SCO family protein [Chloroflexi bacterium]|nr:SCO family protein [Chloroflexota bacterium]
MPSNVAHASPRHAGMSLGELLADALRGPLAQALSLAVALGLFLLAFGPRLGLRDTFRGASLGFTPAPAFALTDQHGQRVALDELVGSPVVLTFIYTSCQTICPMTTATVDHAIGMLDEDAGSVRTLAVTVDPERDGPAELNAYADRYHLRPGWQLLSGPASEVNQVVGAYHAEPLAAVALSEATGQATGEHVAHEAGVPAAQSADLAHPTMVLLVDGQGTKRFAYGPGFTAEDLAHDIQLMQRDMGGPTVPFPLY